MAKFNPAMLVPAQSAPEFAKAGGARTAKQVALDNIARSKHLFAHPDEEGRRSFTVAGDKVKFSVRVSNTALVLAEVDVPGSTDKLPVREMSVPKAVFIEALDYYADRIKAGEFDALLTAMGERKEARATKMRETRATKKAAKVEGAPTKS